MSRYTRLAIWFVFFLLAAVTIPAETADFESDPDFAQVRSVRLVHRGSGSWDVSVSVFHNDEGWSHYADAWQILDDSTGELLEERILAHPHDTEQPFMRSLGGVRIPSDLRTVRIRAKCNVHGFGGRELVIELPREARIGLEVTAE